MRLIGVLLVLFFALRPHPILGRLQGQASCAGPSIGSLIIAGLLQPSASSGEESGTVWASGFDLPGRHRGYRNRARLVNRRLRSTGGRQRHRARRHRDAGVSPLQAGSEQLTAMPIPSGSSTIVEGAVEKKSKRGRRATIPTDHVCCVARGCYGYGKFGPHPAHNVTGAGLYETKSNGRLQMYRCGWCKKRFSETQGTVFFDLKTPSETVYRALTALSEGVSIRSTARIFGERPETILLWLRRAGQHSQQVSDYLLRDLHVCQAQLDELWTFVRKKEKTLSAWEQLHTEYGDTWVWVVFDPVNKMVLAMLVGEREEEQAVGLLSQLKARLAEGCLPLFTSDQLPHYLKALIAVFGRWVQPQRQGDRGRFPSPRQEAPENLQYATVNKQKERGRVVSVKTQAVLGSQAEILQRIQESLPGTKINTSFIERLNLTLRHLVSRLRRKGLTFSKKREYLVWHLQLATAYYHFVRTHGALRQRLPQPIPTRGSPKLWQPRTPAMSAGLTDHPWSMKELLSFRVPPAIAA